jgi:mono/diheme cytochrome c family protein
MNQETADNREGAKSAKASRSNPMFFLRVFLRVLCAFAVALSLSCEQRVKGESTKPQASAHSSSSVKTIDVPTYQPQLPPGPGREAFAAACLTCHSTRYITMQPALTAEKWEASVKKMRDTYKAPVTDEQIPEIVKYLMATKESGITSGWESAVVTTRAKPDSTIAGKADLARGENVFAQNCASCHGADGKSKTAGAAEQFPHATDLTTAAFSKERLAQVIHHGVPGTAMPGYPNLSADDVASLVAYTQKLSAKAEKVNAPAADVKALYAQNCLSCHGATGAGDGPQAPLQPRVPANFKLKQPTAEQAQNAIKNGIPGSTMPQWKTKLNEEQIKQLSDYARSLYSGS